MSMFEARDSIAFGEDSTAVAAKPAMQFSAEVASRLLDLLSSDDAFRALLLSNPRAAMAQVGFVTPEQDRDIKGRDPIICFFGMKSLGSKESIKAARAELHASFSTSAFHYAMSA